VSTLRIFYLRVRVKLFQVIFLSTGRFSYNNFDVGTAPGTRYIEKSRSHLEGIPTASFWNTYLNSHNNGLSSIFNSLLYIAYTRHTLFD
jgi:hypothetical protein